MDLLTQLAETRIREAIDRGELEHLPGEGRPLVLDDDRNVPEELRVAYRVLRNAGVLPPEIELRHEIASVEALLARLAAGQREHVRAAQRLAALRLRLSEARGARSIRFDPAYHRQLLDKLG